ncbi:50S ribosomal protein L16 [Candidatus Shapirobacteria bacterium CG_4_8_14_3_um_filter_35_11]|uniref:Large ribosomal subunit protein uL16 n=6 Tax=Candidatus Shapironibacteriota TaxID=1752721 RepID=A0A1J5I6V4_9BACT|nr:MAG: 50S ribosomal protein L16 [Candidatus Shapirobacteria bacterium CG2_30_35_20]PIV07747.1 MAG: 50S ribosomal protein L16 [Candidatus Shapirobacteria bacterium CG03_land_8_20_14_0_80_35_14]PIX68351.1 MAG: 50S ribosomal protein L16 [Candidatus Shapirobacteria bacterium CG_4_10_14_3_um_filter_35_13]PJA51305.1 MAG: 50S ribosomal protein L16 [Candidatus Shapirobacteria bacterium CG_4_9_14_3_um_filter_36_12]PJC80346.1 MAG: 50S ribosomal protein L16 [Candidatus Shapirobacteria bacterium CG_4_8_1
MLQPSRTKFRKAFRGRMHGLSAGNLVEFGEYGLKAMECTWITSNQIESARRSIAHSTKRAGRMWIRIFPDKPFTKKGEGTMGAGKGDVKGYVAVVKPGRILFEITGISKPDAREAMRLAGAKLPCVTKFVKKL